MLSREVMGIFCLGVVWTTALLVAAAALHDLADLRRIARLARKVVTGVVVDGDFAAWNVDQTARAIDVKGGRAIAFHDRGFRSEIFGGNIRKDDGTVYEVSATNGNVWIAEDVRKRAAECADDATFDDVYAQARKAKGHPRTTTVRVRAGDRVFVTLSARLADTLVSTFDPAVFCAKKSALVAVFIPLELAVCAGATWLALQPPHFGRTSIIGAIACFAFFLGVTPIAVSLRESVRRPHEAFIRATWSRPTD